MSELVSAEDTALLYGVTKAELLAELARQNRAAAEPFAIPADWIRQGRRLYREAAAAIGTDDMAAVIAERRRREGLPPNPTPLKEH